MNGMTRKQQSAFPEVATIRKGTLKKKNAKGESVWGDDLKDQFRVVFMPECEDMAKVFQSIYKTDQPTVIHAMVPFPSVWKAWDHHNEAYNAGRLIARADDDHYLMLRDPLTGEYKIRDGEPYKAFTPKDVISYSRDGRTFNLVMKASGRLSLWLPALERMVFVTLKTTSYYDCQNISANLAAVQAIADALNGGNAAGIPLLIYRKEQEVCWNKPDGTAQRVKKWLVAIEVDPAFVKAALVRYSQFALTGAQPVGYPTPGEPITGNEDPDLAEEDEDAGQEHVTPTDDWKSLVSDGDFRPESQQHPPIEPPVVTATRYPNAVDPERVLAAAPHDTDGKLTRPMAPDVLKAALDRKAKKTFAGQTATQKQKGLAAMLIEQVFAGPDASKIRHSITGYLLGVESLNDASGEQVLALLDWLKPEQDKSGEYLISPMAAKELTAVWPLTCEMAGQLKMF